MFTDATVNTFIPKNTAISFDRVTFAYKQGEEVFRDASFAIPKGGFFFLNGASGSGKSSLLKLIYNANKYYLGSLKVMGQEMKTIKERQLPDFRRKIGIVFQEFHLFDHLSTVDNVALPLTLNGEDLLHAREKAAELLSWIGLGSFLHKMPTILSGGQRQRVAMARAIINDPEIILADEPTGHVDDANAMKIMALFQSLHEKGKTLILSTHNRTIMDTMGYPQLTIENGTVTLKKDDPRFSVSGIERSHVNPAGFSPERESNPYAREANHPYTPESSYTQAPKVNLFKEVENV